MREGGLGAPVRHPLDWQNPDFTDPAKLDAEVRRQFDICHGCRRCFNLCDTFPRLFDLIDASPSGELDQVESAGFKPVMEACTLCDMCFMTKCPYVPPHEFNLDVPHLILRYRVAERAKGGGDFWSEQLARTDRNGKLGSLAAPLANWATERSNRLTRPLLDKVAGVHPEADLPKFHGRTFAARAEADPAAANEAAPAFGRKAVLYATCFVNYNNPQVGEAARRVLARNGVACEVEYPLCCGMPQLEHGMVADVAGRARKAALAMKPHLDAGKDIVALIPSCALMLKFEWPLLLPDDPDVKRLAAATFDLSEYVVEIARQHGGLVEGMRAPEGGVALHLACHARAQNMGAKGAEMLRLMPGADVQVIERCSGHGGSWGVRSENFEVALKVGRPVAKSVATGGKAQIASECPLAAMHIHQGVERLPDTPAPPPAAHPIELLARAYGLAP